MTADTSIAGTHLSLPFCYLSCQGNLGALPCSSSVCDVISESTSASISFVDMSETSFFSDPEPAADSASSTLPSAVVGRGNSPLPSRERFTSVDVPGRFAPVRVKSS